MKPNAIPEKHVNILESASEEDIYADAIQVFEQSYQASCYFLIIACRRYYPYRIDVLKNIFFLFLRYYARNEDDLFENEEVSSQKYLITAIFQSELQKI